MTCSVVLLDHIHESTSLILQLQVRIIEFVGAHLSNWVTATSLNNSSRRRRIFNNILKLIILVGKKKWQMGQIRLDPSWIPTPSIHPHMRLYPVDVWAWHEKLTNFCWVFNMSYRFNPSSHQCWRWKMITEFLLDPTGNNNSNKQGKTWNLYIYMWNSGSSGLREATKISTAWRKNNKKNILAKEFLIFFIEGVNLSHLVLVMTLWVRSTSARLETRTSSSSLSGRESIAEAARLACLAASSFVLCIPRLFPR